MSVRVRFAPSPTGNLHIGGSRTALYCYLFAKKENGKFVLRIEDTDLERSTKESEVSIMNDLKWLGIEHNEGPDIGGDFGPYRQSERLDIYKGYAQKFIEEGKAYPCFLSQDELEELSEKAKLEKKAPHHYHNKYANFDKEEARKRIDTGESYVIRFKNLQKTYSFSDIVRGEVTFQPDMVGDFVIMRSNGMPVYNFCCVIDDHLMKISHVFRAEEHLPNTLRQLIIYEALDAKAPTFAHCSLLVGADRQKLSKRHAATSVIQYKEQGFLPQAMNNYLCLLGWSHPDEVDIFSNDDVIPVFETNRFNKAPALYDIEKLKFFNEQHLRKLNDDQLFEYVNPFLKSNHFYNSQDKNWQKTLLCSFKEKVQLPQDYLEFINIIVGDNLEINDDLKDIFSWETTSQMVNYLKNEVKNLVDAGSLFCTEDQFNDWMNHLKKELKIKGKPLFMGARGLLTFQAHGPDLKHLIPLTPLVKISDRLNNASQL